MTEKDEWSEWADILGRKTCDHVEHLMRQFHLEEITVEQLKASISTAYHLTSGVVPRDVSDMLALIDKEFAIG